MYRLSHSHDLTTPNKVVGSLHWVINKTGAAAGLFVVRKIKSYDSMLEEQNKFRIVTKKMESSRCTYTIFDSLV